MPERAPRMPEAERREANPRRALERRYRELFSEREKLQKALNEYEPRDFQIALQEEEVGRDTVFRIRDRWLERVRAETELLTDADTLGLRLFVEDLENQPSLPGVSITFRSNETYEKNLRNIGSLRLEGGSYQHVTKEIHLAEFKTTLRSQLDWFLYYGELDPSTETLVHEMIHAGHFLRSSNTNVVLTEIQAYSHGLLSRAPGTEDPIEHLQTLTMENGLYGYDADQVITAYIAVSGLYALGKTSAEISALTATSRYDHQSERYVPLEDVYEQAVRAAGLDDLDEQALKDIWQLQSRNQSLKAQVLLYQTIDTEMPFEERMRVKDAFMSETILGVTRYLPNGKSEIFKHASTVMPKSAEYGRHGNKTRGIYFGFDMNADIDSGKPVPFTIGRYEVGGKASTMEPFRDHKDRVRLLSELREHARTIALEKKYPFFMYEVLGFWPLKGDNAVLAKDILRALYRPDEIQTLIHGEANHLERIREELEQEKRIAAARKKNGRPDTIESAEKIRIFENELERCRIIAEIFNLKLDDILAPAPKK